MSPADFFGEAMTVRVIDEAERQLWFGCMFGLVLYGLVLAGDMCADHIKAKTAAAEFILYRERTFTEVRSETKRLFYIDRRGRLRRRAEISSRFPPGMILYEYSPPPTPPAKRRTTEDTWPERSSSDPASSKSMSTKKESALRRRF